MTAALAYETRPESPLREPVSLWHLLREGWFIALLALLALGPISLVIGGSKNARLVVVTAGFIVIVAGILAARTLSARVILALAFGVLFEWNYFFPPHFGHLIAEPSVALAILILIMEGQRRDRTVLHEAAPSSNAILGLLYFALLTALLMAQFFHGFNIAFAIRYYLLQYIYPIPFILLGVRIVRNQEIAGVADGIILLGTLVAISMLAGYLFGVSLLVHMGEWNVETEFYRFGGLLGNPNASSMLVGMALLLSIMRLRAASGVLKPILVFLTVMFGVVLVMAQSRGPILTVGLVLLVLLTRRRWRGATFVLLILGGIALGLLGGRGTFTTEGGSVVERFAQSEEGITSRLRIMGESLRLFSEHPLGLGAPPAHISYLSGVRRVEHSEYLSFLVQGGAQSALVLAFLLMAIAVMWARARMRRAPYRPSSFLKLSLLFLALYFTYEHPMTLRQELNHLIHLIAGVFAGSLIYAGSRHSAEYELEPADYHAGEPLPAGGFYGT